MTESVRLRLEPTASTPQPVPLQDGLARETQRSLRKKRKGKLYALRVSVVSFYVLFMQSLRILYAFSPPVRYNHFVIQGVSQLFERFHDASQALPEVETEEMRRSRMEVLPQVAPRVEDHSL